MMQTGANKAHIMTVIPPNLNCQTEKGISDYGHWKASWLKYCCIVADFILTSWASLNIWNGVKRATNKVAYKLGWGKE